MNTNRESGQTLTEYMILLMLIAIIGIAAVKQFGGSVKDRIERARSEVEKI